MIGTFKKRKCTPYMILIHSNPCVLVTHSDQLNIIIYSHVLCINLFLPAMYPFFLII